MYDRERTSWGVQITDRPFTLPAAKMGMFIAAEVALVRERRSTEIKFSFTDAMGDRKLSVSEMVVWIEHLRAVLDGAKKEAEALKNAAPTSKKPAALKSKKSAALKGKAKKKA